MPATPARNLSIRLVLPSMRLVLPLLLVLLAPRPAAAQDPDEPDADLPHGGASNRGIFFDPASLRSDVPEMRELARAIAAGSTDVRQLRAWWRLYVRLYPFDAAPPRDLMEK